jgi:hypothetical protein
MHARIHPTVHGPMPITFHAPHLCGLMVPAGHRIALQRGTVQMPRGAFVLGLAPRRQGSLLKLWIPPAEHVGTMRPARGPPPQPLAVTCPTGSHPYLVVDGGTDKLLRGGWRP